MRMTEMRGWQKGLHLLSLEVVGQLPSPIDLAIVLIHTYIY